MKLTDILSNLFFISFIILSAWIITHPDDYSGKHVCDICREQGFICAIPFSYSNVDIINKANMLCFEECMGNETDFRKLWEVINETKDR